ncbi:unnamed protein product, partial [marine sediment metagenome]
MKFKLSKKVLVDAISKVQGTISPNPIMPILSNVLIHATPKGIVLVGATLDRTVRVAIPITSSEG